MRRANILLLCLTAASALICLAIGEAKATDTPLPSPGISAPVRECTINAPVLFSTSKVSIKVEAGPGAASNTLADQFPVSGPCPAGVSDTTCKQWIYRWTVQTSGATLQKALNSVDSDVTIHTSTPAGATVIKTLPAFIPVDTEGERFLKFEANTTSEFIGSYWTPINVTPGTLTAAALGKKGTSLNVFFGRCAIAGADNVITQSNEAVADLRTFKITGCTVAFQVDRDGKVIPGTIQIVVDPDNPNPGNCIPEETTDPLVIDGKTIEFVGAVQFTQGGSCNYSWTNTAGGRSTVSCLNCCINKATNQCVLKTSLVSPTTQCKTGTF